MQGEELPDGQPEPQNGQPPARRWPNDPSDPGFNPRLALDGSGRAVCGAKNRPSARYPYCQTDKLFPNGRCRMHGGKSLKGPANPAWKGGHRSKFLPKPVASLYREAQNDLELMHARGTVALLETRVRQLMQRLATPESDSLWSDLKAAAEELEAAHQEPDPEARASKVLALSAELVELTNRGVNDEAAWKELRAVEREKLHAQQVEWNRLRDMRQLATAEEVYDLVRAIAESVARQVSNPKERLAVVNDIIRFTHADQQRPPVGALPAAADGNIQAEVDA
jgi:hypothetical protein